MKKFAGAVRAALRGKRSTALSTAKEDIMATALKIDPPFGSPSWFYAMVEAAKKEPVMQVTALTPALAKAMLDNNSENRGIRKIKLAQYANDMAQGRWTLNGEPIIISKEGRLNDGQHRCLAAIDANASVPVVIMFGIDRETRLTVDQGGARTAGDFLGMEGVANAGLVSAIARSVLAFDASGGQNLNESGKITSAQIRDRVANDPALADAATFGHTNSAYSSKFAAGSIIGFAFYVLSRVHRDDARTFLERVCRGDGLRMRDPAHTLREKLMGEGKSRDRKIAMILRAWNFHRRGVKVSANSLTATLPFPALL